MPTHIPFQHDAPVLTDREALAAAERFGLRPVAVNPRSFFSDADHGGVTLSRVGSACLVHVP